MILVVVYVGAVAVLFLFVVMMLDVDFAELRAGLPAISADRRAGRRHPARRTAARGRRPGRSRPACRSASPRRSRPADSHQHRGARPRALHALRLLLPGRRPGAAGRHDRRHRADAAPQARRQAAEHRRAGARAPAASVDRGASRSGRGEGIVAHDHRARPLSAVAAILFTLGMFGIFLNRKNVIIILMSIELILLAVNINLVAFSAFLGDLVGQVFALIVLTVAAAEAAIGLAILVAFSATAARSRSKTSTDEGLTTAADVSGDRLPAAARRHHRRPDRAGRRARRHPGGVRRRRMAITPHRPREPADAHDDVASSTAGSRSAELVTTALLVLSWCCPGSPSSTSASRPRRRVRCRLDHVGRPRGRLGAAHRHAHRRDAGRGDDRLVARASLFDRLHGTTIRTSRASSPICRSSPSPCWCW